MKIPWLNKWTISAILVLVVLLVGTLWLWADSTTIKIFLCFAGLVVTFYGSAIDIDEATGRHELKKPITRWLGPVCIAAVICIGTVSQIEHDVTDSKNQLRQSQSQIARLQTGTNQLMQDLADTKADDKANADKLALKSDELTSIMVRQTQQSSKYHTKQAYQASLDELAEKMHADQLRSLEVETQQKQRALIIRDELLQTSNNVRLLNQSVNGFERTVNQLQNCSVSYRVRIPLSDPNLAVFRQGLLKSYSDLQVRVRASQANGTTYVFANDPDFSQIYNDRVVSIHGQNSYDLGLQIRDSSSLFSLVPAGMFDYPILISAWKKGNLTRDRDLVMLTRSGYCKPILVYNIRRGSIEIQYMGCVTSPFKLSGRITTIPDLMGAHVEIIRNDRLDDGEAYDGDRRPANLKLNARIVSMEFDFAGRPFQFPDWALSHRTGLLGEDVCTLTFRDTPETMNAFNSLIE